MTNACSMMVGIRPFRSEIKSIAAEVRPVKSAFEVCRSGDFDGEARDSRFGVRVPIKDNFAMLRYVSLCSIALLSWTAVSGQQTASSRDLLARARTILKASPLIDGH